MLSHCERITDIGIRHLVAGTTVTETLQVLELDNCPLITGPVPGSVEVHCRKLEHYWYVLQIARPCLREFIGGQEVISTTPHSHGILMFPKKLGSLLSHSVIS